VDAEVRPQPGDFLFWLFDLINLVFTIIFAVELMFNVICFWFWPFFKDGWLIFDACIVVLSLAGLLFQNAPSAKQLRVLKILRVLRAFGRLKDLRKIINGIMASIRPLAQALIIAVLFLSIFCTLGTDMFGDEASTHFGNFSRSFYTLFTVILGRWPDDLLPSFREDGSAILQNCLFFYSYMLVEVIVILQGVYPLSLSAPVTFHPQSVSIHA
jgi:voltage-gated sodium channel